jgi:alpha-tubulin suppressor-like RCC1 family protein
MWRKRVLPTVLSAALLTAGFLAVGPAVAAAATGQSVPVTGTDYHPIAPVRVLDTRTGTGGVTGAVRAGQVVTIDLSGQVPGSAYDTTSVVLNVTATDVTSSTYVTVFPTGGSVPTASNLNVPTGQTRANLVTVAPRNGQVSFFNRFGSVDLVADLEGYNTLDPGSEFTPTGPTRVLDTRNGTPVQPNQSVSLNLTGRIPADATAVSLNLTALDATAPTYVTAYPSGTPPLASSLNLTPGEIVPNQVIVAVGPGDTIQLYNKFGTVDLVADLDGYYGPDTAGSFTAFRPSRVLDTRNGTGTGGRIAPVGAGATIALDLSDRVPPAATAVVLNLTGADGTQGTFVTTWAAGAPQPVASSLNLDAGEIAANLVTVPLSSSGVINLYNRFGSVDLIADIAGYVAPPAPVCSSGCGYTWDDADGDGELGVRGAYSSGVPTALYGLTGVTSMVGSDATGYALRADGTLWSWGNNTYGQLDDGTPGGTCTGDNVCDSIAPIRAVGLSGVTAVSGAWSGAFALRSDGTVWAIGQTRSITGFGNPAPTQVAGLTGVTAIASGSSDLYALRSDGTVWALGMDNYGQLGNGTTCDTSTCPSAPVQVSGLTGVTAVSGGYLDGYALKSDGTVWTWGYDALGLNTGSVGTASDVPVRITGLSGITAIASNSSDLNVVDTNAGFGANSFGLALKSDGTVLGWGYNQMGQLGDGNHDGSANGWVFTPTPVSGLTGVTAIGAGNNTGYAARSDGTAWAWGDGEDGQLGNGQVGESDVPTQISGLTGVTAVGGGSGFGFAVVAQQ